MWLCLGSTIERTQPCSDLHSASLRSADCAAIGGGSSSAADIMNGTLVLMRPATEQRRVGAEIRNPALAQIVLGGEIIAAGGQDGAGEAGALRPVELGMGYVGG